MKEPFTLYSSGIALARFAAERADITHSSRDIFGLDFSEPQPMTAQNDTDYAAVKLQPYRLLTLRTEFEAAAASAPAEFSVDGLRYTRAERNGLLYYIQRGVKFPCDALFRDGRLIAWLCPCREQANLLVRDGFEEYTPLALWKDYAARSLYGVSMLGTFHMPMRDGVELAADVYLPEGAPLPVPALLVRTPYDKDDGAQTYFRYVRRGYAVVVQDVRGRNESGGE